MSLKRSLAFTFGSQFPKLFLSIITGIFITRLLGPEAKGAYAIFLANIQLFLLLLGFGLSSSLIFFTAKKLIPEANQLGISILLTLLSVSLLSIILFGSRVQGLIDLLLPDGYQTSLFKVLLIANFAVDMLAASFIGILAGRKQFQFTSTVAVAQTAIMFIVVLAYYYFISFQGATALLHILIITLIIHFSALCSYLGAYRKQVSEWPNFALKKSEVKSLLTYSGLMYLASVLNFFNYRLDLWIVDEYASTASLGHYSLAANLAQVLWMISVPMGSVLMTYFSSNEDMQYRAKILGVFSRLTSTAVIILVIGGILVADWLIPLVYGEEFREAVMSFKILLPGLALSTIYKIFVPINIAHAKLKYNLTAVVVSLMFTVALDLYLIPRYGIEGAAFATSVAYFVSFIIVISFTIIKLKYPLTNYFLLNRKDLMFIKINILNKS